MMSAVTTIVLRSRPNGSRMLLRLSHCSGSQKLRRPHGAIAACDDENFLPRHFHFKWIGEFPSAVNVVSVATHCTGPDNHAGSHGFHKREFHGFPFQNTIGVVKRELDISIGRETYGVIVVIHISPQTRGRRAR